MHNEFKNKKEIRLGLVLGMDQDFDELKHNIHGFFYCLMQFNPLLSLIFFI
jgi:hypothetical protein